MIKFNLNAYYDLDLAHVYYKEFVEGEGGQIVDTFYTGRSVGYVAIYENEQIANMPYFKKSRLARMKKEDLIELAEMLGISEGTKAELIADLLTVSNRQFQAKHFENVDYSDLDYDFSICGYSQGDYVKVIVFGSGDFKKSYSSEYLTNLFFDCPITIGFEIVEIENSDFYHTANEKTIDNFFLCEYLDNVYKYDRELLILNVEKYYKGEYKAEILEYLKENLPKELDYK